ncbi:hypothetical protein IGI04_013759 [Brassica rapa subsp. trilocularis]|uniref:Uncharacterized protein n=1 Tax=Brassica rapa subsp. trilocularis TaxID=1813537 RepID=A0ABQ7N9R4_BRACM|nr:hypothetical protein IGI04_013759 [Brassica rapa subsp. trilocularis]
MGERKEGPIAQFLGYGPPLQCITTPFPPRLGVTQSYRCLYSYPAIFIRCYGPASPPFLNATAAALSFFPPSPGILSHPSRVRETGSEIYNTKRPPPPLAAAHGEERERGERDAVRREKRGRGSTGRERERSSTARASCLRDFSAELRSGISDERQGSLLFKTPNGTLGPTQLKRTIPPLFLLLPVKSPALVGPSPSSSGTDRLCSVLRPLPAKTRRDSILPAPLFLPCHFYPMLWPRISAVFERYDRRVIFLSTLPGYFIPPFPEVRETGSEIYNTKRPPPPLAAAHGEERERGERCGEEREKRERQRGEREREIVDG